MAYIGSSKGKKALWVNPITHKEIKVISVEEGETMAGIVDELLLLRRKVKKVRTGVKKFDFKI